MQVRWWHFVLTSITMWGLFVLLWRFQNPNASPVVAETIPAGPNAQMALQLKHE